MRRSHGSSEDRLTGDKLNFSKVELFLFTFYFLFTQHICPGMCLIYVKSSNPVSGDTRKTGISPLPSFLRETR